MDSLSPSLPSGFARLLVTLIAAAIVAGASPSAFALGPAPEFAPPREVVTASVDGFMTELETGDLNGDGFTDVVVTRLTFPSEHVTHPIGVFLADGRGGFRDGNALFSGPPPRTEHARQIVIADFNGDHRNDVFVADHGYDAAPFPGHQNSLALSTPDGRLVDATANLPARSDFSHSATAADIDRDGDLDIYVGNIYGGTPPGVSPALLINDGSGHFGDEPARLPAPQSGDDSHRYTRSLFTDVNGDGAPDLVLGADNNTQASEVLLNNGSGSFSAVTGAMPPKELGATAIVIALETLDANRDGRPDLIAAFQRANFTGRRLQVLIGNGDGTFRDETASRLSEQDEGDTSVKSIRVADLNSDGRADFALSLFYQPPAPPLMYLDDGSGVFRRHVAGSPVVDFALLDANADGRIDIFSSSPGRSERHALQRQLTDDDGDGVEFEADNCPAVANSDQANLDHDSLGDACDPDRDGDGVADVTDTCPRLPSTRASGCPLAALVIRHPPRSRRAGRKAISLNTGVGARCPPAGVPCSGKVTATARGRARRGRRRPKAIALCRARYNVPPGRAAAISCKLTRRAAKALRKARKLKTKIALTLTGPDGTPVALKRTAIIKPPKR